MRNALFLVATVAYSPGCADHCSPVGGYGCDNLPTGTHVQLCDPASSTITVAKDCSAMGQQCVESAWFMESSNPTISDPSSYGCAPASCNGACFKEGQSWCLLDTVRTCVKTGDTCSQAQSGTNCAMAFNKKCVVANGAATCM